MARVAAVALALLGGADAARLSSVKKHTAASTCGVKGAEARNVSMNIVNGNKAKECEWKWQVGLKSDPGNSKPFCGGMLISPEWVLTAAHCGDSPDFWVMSGDWKATAGSGNEQVREAVQLIRHPLYNPREQSYDFSLVRLDSPMEFNECVGSVCLPTEGADVQPGTQCWITGWGTLSSGGNQPAILQEAKVTILSNERCKNKFSYTPDQIDESMLCAQGKNADGSISDACQGDSGGPLVCNTGGSWILYGATSWGIGCAGADYPGIWARVHWALDWIEETMANPDAPPAEEPARGQCPAFARFPEPDMDGDCACPRGKICSTDGSNTNCPTSGGLGGWGGYYFNVNCAACQCVSK